MDFLYKIILFHIFLWKHLLKYCICFISGKIFRFVFVLFQGKYLYSFCISGDANKRQTINKVILNKWAEMKTDFIKDLNRLTWEKKQKTFSFISSPSRLQALWHGEMIISFSCWTEETHIVSWLVETSTPLLIQKKMQIW